MSSWWEVTIRLLLAAALGALLGWERETQGKPAGLRTLLLVSLSAAIYVVAAEQWEAQHGYAADAVRAMTGIAQGIGFLGAGVILQSRGEVRWLTTAASLWATAALGMAAGFGMYYIAIVGGILVFATLRWVIVVEERWIHRPPDRKKSDASPEDDDEHRAR